MTFEKERREGCDCKDTECDAYDETCPWNCDIIDVVGDQNLRPQIMVCDEYIPNEVMEVKECLTS